MLSREAYRAVPSPSSTDKRPYMSFKRLFAYHVVCIAQCIKKRMLTVGFFCTYILKPLGNFNSAMADKTLQ